MVYPGKVGKGFVGDFRVHRKAKKNVGRLDFKEKKQVKLERGVGGDNRN